MDGSGTKTAVAERTADGTTRRRRARKQLQPESGQRPAEAGLDPVLLTIERAWTRLTRIPTRSRTYGLVLARAGLPLERSAYPILAYLKDLGSTRMTDLADAIGIDLSTLSRQVAVLERRDLVVRAVDPSDARVRTLRPTESGAAALAGIANAHQLFMAETLAAWTQEDRETLSILIERLVTDAERYLEHELRKTKATP